MINDINIFELQLEEHEGSIGTGNDVFRESL